MAVGDAEPAFVSGNVAYVGSYPGLFPNVPGQPGVPSPQYGVTDEYVFANAYAGLNITPDFVITAYVENVFDNDAITYVHPEAFLDGRHGGIVVGITLEVQLREVCGKLKVWRKVLLPRQPQQV